MGRRYTYYCDNCKTNFKEKDHLNIKTNQHILFVSCFDKEAKTWFQTPVTFSCQEFHFCNADCLAEFLMPKIEKTKELIKKKDKKEV